MARPILELASRPQPTGRQPDQLSPTKLLGFDTGTVIIHCGPEGTGDVLKSGAVEPKRRVKGTVRVRLKDGVLDPQGQTIRRALTQMGYDWVQEVRTGRTFEIEMEDGDAATAQRRLREISEKLLANPVIETFQVEVRQ